MLLTKKIISPGKNYAQAFHQDPEPNIASFGRQLPMVEAN